MKRVTLEAFTGRNLAGRNLGLITVEYEGTSRDKALAIGRMFRERGARSAREV